jgi:sec-independent protein translocase protein TatB
MFDIGWGELMLIGMVALIAIGPKELPGALRTLGQWMTKIRRMASEFQGQFQEAMREAELSELRKEVDEMAAKAADYTNFDPIEDIRKDIEKAADLPNLDAPVTAEPVRTEAAPASLPPAAPAEDSVEAAVPAQSEPTSMPAAEPVEAAGKPDAGKAA